MCGLAGVVGQIREGDEDLVAGMTEQLRHRGPDSGRVKTFDGAVLGHRRLRVIDLHPIADQPMTDEAGRYWVLFNGEIYNFRELRRHLKKVGHRFVSHSDTEVIVHLVEEQGDDFVHHLRGMFAIAVWDTLKRTLLLVRDRLGIKPLYYENRPGRVVFSSEVRSLPGASRGLDEYSLACYLQLGWIPSPRTVFRDIRELPPGHRLQWHDGRTSIEPWDDNLPQPLEGQPGLLQLSQALTDSVERHLVADVPVGVFLSAGLDSAVIATLAARSDANTTAYTVAFPDAPDETEGATCMARRVGLPHEVVPISGDDVLGSIDMAIDAMDQPTVDGLNTWVISRRVRERGAVVALSGLGGDELFSGYSTFRYVPRIGAVIERTARIPGPVRALPSALMGLSRHTAHRREQKVLDALRTPGLGSAYAAVRGVMSRSEVERLRGGWGRDLRRWSPIPEPRFDRSVRQLELHHYLPDQLLRDTDSMSMAHSLEVRVPLLDDQVVLAAAAAQSVPGAPRGKQLLAAAVDPELLNVAKAPKRTFTLPIGSWLKGPLREWSEDSMDLLTHAGLGFDRNELEKFFLDFHSGFVGWRSLWALSVLGAWLSRHP